MRVLTKSSHDDHDLGEVYELPEGELLDRLLAAGMVVPADEWTFRYEPPQNPTGDCRYVFERVAKPAEPETRVAPPTVHEVLPEPETR